MNKATRENLTDAVRRLLRSRFKDEQTGEPYTGETVSHLIDELRSEGWRNLGAPHDFADTLTTLGFAVKHGRSIGRNQRALTVTI